MHMVEYRLGVCIQSANDPVGPPYMSVTSSAPPCSAQSAPLGLAEHQHHPPRPAEGLLQPYTEYYDATHGISPTEVSKDSQARFRTYTK